MGVTDVTALIGQLAQLGRTPAGGYRRFAWTAEDVALRAWFADRAGERGLEVVLDRAGNQLEWWGAPRRPVGVVNFADEEGARFGVACAGSRLLTGALAPVHALGLVDSDGVTAGDARRAAGVAATVDDVGRDDRALRRIGAFVELHVEQGRGLVDLGSSVGVGTGIWPHGRWRVDLPGRADHAGTTQLTDRDDPTLAHARVVLAARSAADRLGVLATCGKVLVRPNGVNAIPSGVTVWLDVRGRTERPVRQLVDEIRALACAHGGDVTEESWTADTAFDEALCTRLAGVVGTAGNPVPRLATGAGHDAGVLAAAGIPVSMLFVRNPTGVSHSPAEHADPADCAAGVTALAAVLRDLAGER